MATSFSLASEVRVFPCPHCNETINTSMPQCSFCGAPIDHAAAEAAAEATSRISAAVSDASYLKIMAWFILTFFLLAFVPILNLIGGVGLLFVSYALPILCIRWWVKYGSIRTDDADYPRARRTAIIITAIASLNLVREILTRLLQFFGGLTRW